MPLLQNWPVCSLVPSLVQPCYSGWYRWDDVPSVEENNYGEDFSLGLVAASGSVALIIPPSITLIAYGAATGTSVGALFIGGIGAGIMYGLVFLAYCYYYAVKNKLPGAKPSFREIVACKGGHLGLGSSYNYFRWYLCRVFTPTEAAGVSVVYAIFVSMFIYKELTWKQLLDICRARPRPLGNNGLGGFFLLPLVGFLPLGKFPKR